MQQLTTTPFGRRKVTAGLIATRAAAAAPAPVASVDKWQVFRDLTAARDRDGGLATAFGFDLRPLLSRAPEIAATARATRDAAEALKRQRERLVLMLRDCEKLAGFVAEGQCADSSQTAAIAELKRALRRKLDAATLDRLCADAECIRAQVENRLSTNHLAAESIGPDARNERHNQDSDSDESCFDSAVPCMTADRRSDCDVPQSHEARGRAGQAAQSDMDAITLRQVTAACPSLARYFGRQPADWSDLIRASETIRPWLGITAETHAHAVTAMGPLSAAISLACILERSAEIRTPGAYLRSLSLRAANTRFNPAPMVLALLRRQGGKLTAVNSTPVRAQAQS